MKTTCITLLFIIASITLNAQAPLDKGRTQFNAGVGLSSWGLPIYLGLDHSVHPDITLGGEVSFRAYNERFNKNRYNHSVVGLSGNFNYHFNRILSIPPEWNFYAGINLGFYFWNSPSNYPGNRVSGLGLGAQVGGRYFFTPRTGINLELGGGNAFSGGKIGLTILI